MKNKNTLSKEMRKKLGNLKDNLRHELLQYIETYLKEKKTFKTRRIGREKNGRIKYFKGKNLEQTQRRLSLIYRKIKNGGLVTLSEFTGLGHLLEEEPKFSDSCYYYEDPGNPYFYFSPFIKENEPLEFQNPYSPLEEFMGQ